MSEREGDVFIESNEGNKPSKLKNALKFLASFVTGKKLRNQVNFKIDNNVWKYPPIFMALLTTFQISVFIFYAIRYVFELTDDEIEKARFFGGCLTSVFSVSPAHPYQIWRYFTHSFIHLRPYHLFKNMIVQIFIGIPQEVAFRINIIGPLYFGGVAFSEIILSALRRRSIFLCGASGGDYALIFAQVANLIMNWKEVPYRKTQALILFVDVFLDFAEDIVNVLYGSGSKYEHSTHMHAAIYGLLYGLFIMHFKKENVRLQVARYIFLSAYILCLAVSIIQIFIYYFEDLRDGVFDAEIYYLPFGTDQQTELEN